MAMIYYWGLLAFQINDGRYDSGLRVGDFVLRICICWLLIYDWVLMIANLALRIYDWWYDSGLRFENLGSILGIGGTENGEVKVTDHKVGKYREHWRGKLRIQNGGLRNTNGGLMIEYWTLKITDSKLGVDAGKLHSGHRYLKIADFYCIKTLCKAEKIWDVPYG